MIMLELQKITKSYTVGPTTLEVLRGISLRVGTGELLSVIGASGCGKSTLMNIIGLLDKPSSGLYLMDERPVTYDNDRELSEIRNKTIGFVFQSYHLLQRLTAIENVALPLVYRGESRKYIQRQAENYLKLVEMDSHAEHKPSELSGGQQQRVAIARALIGTPSLILADEPTGALDSQVGQEIMNLFVSLNETKGITVVIITHDPKIASQCKRVVTMRDGKVYEDDHLPEPHRA